MTYHRAYVYEKGIYYQEGNYWKQKFLESNQNLQFLRSENDRTNERYLILCSKNQDLTQEKQLLKETINKLKKQKSELTTQLQQERTFIDKIKKIISRRQSRLQHQNDLKNQKNAIEKSLQKIIVEVMYYKAFAIRATIQKSSQIKSQEEKACEFLNDFRNCYKIDNRQRYQKYWQEERRISQLVNRFKKIINCQKLFKYSQIFTHVAQNYSKLSKELEVTKKIINQIIENISIRKKYITYYTSSCSLYKHLQLLMRQICLLYPKNSDENSRKSQYYPTSSSYSVIDGVTYDKFLCFIDKIYQALSQQSYKAKISREKLSAKMKFIQQKTKYHQSYQFQRKEQVQKYADKINKLVPAILSYLDKQSSSIASALHVFKFDLADLEQIMLQINQRRHPGSKQEKQRQLQQYRLIKQYFKEKVDSLSIYLSSDGILLKDKKVSEIVRQIYQQYEVKLLQLNDLKERNRCILLNSIKEKDNIEKDEIQQMNNNVKAEYQNLLSKNKQLQSQLHQIKNNHTQLIQLKNQQISKLQATVQTLHIEIQKVKDQTQRTLQSLRKITNQQNKELKQQITSLKEQFESQSQSLKQKVNREIDQKQAYYIEKQSLLKKQIQFLLEEHTNKLAEKDVTFQQEFRKLQQFYSDKIQSANKEHQAEINSNNQKLQHLSNDLEALKNRNELLQFRQSQLVSQKQQITLVNKGLSQELKFLIIEHQKFIKNQEQEKQIALNLISAEYAKKVEELCKNQKDDQSKILIKTYQSNIQQLNKTLQSLQTHLQATIQEKNSLQLRCNQMAIRAEQLEHQKQLDHQQNQKLMRSAQLKEEQLTIQKNRLENQLSQQKSELQEIKFKFETLKQQKQSSEVLYRELNERLGQKQLEFQIQKKQLQSQLKVQQEQIIKKYQQQSEELTYVINQLQQKQNLQFVQQQNLRSQLEHNDRLINHLTEKVEQKDCQIQKLSLELSQLKGKYEKLSEENEVRTLQITELRTALQNEKQQKQYIEHQFASNQRQHQQKTNLLTQKLNQLQKQHSLIKIRETKLNQQLQQLRKQLYELKQQHDEILQKYIEQVEKHKQDINQQLDKSIQDVSKISQAVGNSFIDNADQLKIEHLQKALQEKQLQFQAIIAKYRMQTEQEIGTLKQKTKKLQQQNRSLESKNELAEAQRQQVIAQLGALKEENKSLTDTIKYLKDNQKYLDGQIEQLMSTVKTQKDEISKLTQVKNKSSKHYKSEVLPETESMLMVPYTHSLFNTDIFSRDQQQKTVLIRHIEKYISSRIVRTRLLHKYDPRNKLNFHQYIDQVPSLCIVVKTQKAIISALYPGTLRDKEILDKGGLLVSVTNNFSYNLFAKKPGDNNKVVFRGMIYDTFFAIFGNAEIRVKSGFKTVFSNFGVSNGYFNSRGHKINNFLNEGDKREVQFEYCQFYQVLFEEEINPQKFITQ